MPYCHRCGTLLDVDAHFCHKCGTPVASFAPYAYVPPAPSAPQPQVHSSRKDPTLLIVGILIAVVVVAVIIIAVFAILYPINFSSSQNNGNLNQISQILQWSNTHANGIVQGASAKTAAISPPTMG